MYTLEQQKLFSLEGDNEFVAVANVSETKKCYVSWYLKKGNVWFKLLDFYNQKNRVDRLKLTIEKWCNSEGIELFLY